MLICMLSTLNLFFEALKFSGNCYVVRRFPLSCMSYQYCFISCIFIYYYYSIILSCFKNKTIKINEYIKFARFVSFLLTLFTRHSCHGWPFQTHCSIYTTISHEFMQLSLFKTMFIQIYVMIFMYI